MPTIDSTNLPLLKKLYYKNGLSMREVGLELGVSIDAVTHFMRYHNLSRRTAYESNKLVFDNKIPTFSTKSLNSRVRELKAMGAMLY